jgi:hypothetical protein
MEGQTSETTNLGARTAPQALVPCGKPQVWRKANSVSRRGTVAAAFSKTASADSDRRIRRRGGVCCRRRSAVVRRGNSGSLGHSLLHKIELRLKRGHPREHIRLLGVRRRRRFLGQRLDVIDGACSLCLDLLSYRRFVKRRPSVSNGWRWR